MPKTPDNFCSTLDDLVPTKPKRPRDANQLAKMIVDLSTGDESEPEMNVKQKAGQLGGLKGGKARADKLSPEERSAIAKKAAEKRWE
jgi:hypothetical protein